MPIGGSGPILVSDILTAKGFRVSGIPSFDFDLASLGTRSPSTPVSFTYLFTQNRKSGPNNVQPHSLSEWYGIGNEPSGVPGTPTLSISGTTLTAVWTNTDAACKTAIILLRLAGTSGPYNPVDPIGAGYTVDQTTTVAAGVSTVNFSIITSGDATYKVAVAHYWENVAPDAGSGFQTAYVLSTDFALYAPGAGSHAYSTTFFAKSTSGSPYLGFALADRCTGAPGDSVTVYHDNTPLAAGARLYAAATGPDLAPLSPLTGDGPWYQFFDGLILYAAEVTVDRLVDFIETC